MIDAPFHQGMRLRGRTGATYLVDEQLGAGGTAVVFELTRTDGSSFAGKALSGHRFAITTTARARFQRESDHLLAIRHPHVLRAVDVAQRGEHLVLITERAESSLHQRLTISPPSDLTAIAWLRQALLGAAAVHQPGFVHRDITPKNLLFMRDGRLVLGDFGTVRAFEDATITVPTDRFGSLIYISEDQLADPHRATARDDLFSIGQVGWQMFTGRLPVSNAPHLARLRPDLDRWLVQVVEDLRSHDAELRPASAEEALDRFEVPE